jgi:hypothetical protein
MLLTRAEMTHDFRGARFDVAKDRERLAWFFNQALYGEVTGIQCGHWLFHAPNLDAARFLAKQAIEEFQHIDNFLRILALIGAEPEKPHGIIRYLATGMMPTSWEEHVSLEMAFGEGLVLACFYALIDTIGHEEIASILSRAVKQEEGHVDFGERQTILAIRGNDRLRRRLLGLNLVSLQMVKRLARYLAKNSDPSHPVLSQVDGFLATVVRSSEIRLERLGLTPSVESLSRAEKLAAVGEAFGSQALRAALRWPLRLIPFAAGLFEPKLLTDTYLSDAALLETFKKAKQRAEMVLWS